MKKIIGIIQPFVATQQIYVYEDGNKLDAAAVELNKVKNVVYIENCYCALKGNSFKGYDTLEEAKK